MILFHYDRHIYTLYMDLPYLSLNMIESIDK